MNYLRNTKVSLEKGVSNKGYEYKYLVLHVLNEKLGVNHQEKIFLNDKDSLMTLMELAEK